MLLTIITPTHNRQKKITNLFKSLLSQEKYNFEWLIIDDGSTDNTKKTVRHFKTTLFPIKYIYQENSGKHIALNTAFNNVNSTLSIIVDDDDQLVKDATQTIEKYWNKYKNNQSICGLVFRRKTIHNKKIGSDFPREETIANYNDYIINKNISGDKAEVFNNSILKRYRYPCFENEKFIGEGVLWSKIAEKYNMAFIDTPIYICEYLDGGLTKSGRTLRINNPLGGMYHTEEYLKKNFATNVRVKNAILYQTYAHFAKIKPRQKDFKLLLALTKIPSYILFLNWKKKYGK